ncbi:MAG TPA: F0F1 ATP synthase subunit A [Armatimonadota bacterium]
MNEWSAQFVNTPIVIAQAMPEHPAANATTATTQAPPVAHEEHVPFFDTQGWFFIISMMAFVIIALFGIFGMRRRQLIPSGTQNVLEWVIEALYGIPVMVMGERGRVYGRFIATFFLYIVVANFLGLIPILKSGTASLSVTLGLALVGFVAVQYFGFKTHGIRYLAHFLGPVPFMAFLILPLEVISEFVRIVSLSMRLYGNMNGEEQVISALATQMHPLVAVVLLPLQILTIFLQAFVFSLLITVYISLATEKHDTNHDGAEAPAH